MHAETEQFDPTLQAWQIDESAFPVGGSTADVLRFAVHYAVLAPSSHNTQPWQFGVEHAHLDLYVDHSRGLPVTDPDDRELVMSCGAALLNLRVTLARFGYDTSIEVLPEPKDPGLLARVRLAGTAPVDPRNEELFAQIVRRRTSRAAFSPEPLRVDLLEKLQAIAAAEGVWCYVATDQEAKAVLADLVADADRRQMSDRRFRRELASWIRSNRSHQLDGIRGYGLGMTEVMSVTAPLALRTFDHGHGKAAQDRAVAEGSPVLAVLGTDEDDTRSWLQAGQALQRVLLQCRAHDVWAGFLNQPIEIDALRPEVALATGRIGYPQLLLRLGHGPEPLPEPRRAVADVLVSDMSTAMTADADNSR